MYFYHVMKSMKECTTYTNRKVRDILMNDVTALSKSHSQENFDASVTLFLEKYENLEEKDPSHMKAIAHLKKVWLSKRNSGWHSGLVPGTVTTNNGLEVTNRIFKKDFKGINVSVDEKKILRASNVLLKITHYR